MKFALIDAANLFNRAHHVCHGDAYTKATMALHIIFQSLGSVYQRCAVDHIVICAEGRSWRYDYYPAYKAKRIQLREMSTPKEKEEQEVFSEILTDFLEYMAVGSRCTVIQTRGAEADDIIARFVQLHPDDEHVIVSGDSDMIQLIDDNVSIFNGVTNQTITHEGVFDDKGNSLVFSVKPSDGKLKISGTIEETKKKKKRDLKGKLKELQREEAKLCDAIRKSKEIYDKAPVDEKITTKSEWEKAEKDLKKVRLNMLKVRADADKEESYYPPSDWVELALFIKCVRGDTGDGIFSAYPGVRFKGSSKKVGIEEAFNDRKNQGFQWNNFMLQTWEKLTEGDTTETVRVIDEYNVNRQLINLTMQPDDVKETIDAVIVSAIQKQPVGNVGIRFLQFCQKYELVRVQDRVNDHIRYLNSPYL